jgi:predicted DNA-binding protein (MmcQ/YjbR family)
MSTATNSIGVDRASLLAYVKETYHTKPEYLWPRYPTYGVLRHKENRKWFGVVMDVPRSKLGLGGEDPISIVDLKCDPVMLGSLLQKPGHFPGYHMNKNHWITVLLDGSVPPQELFPLVDFSYQLTKTKRKKDVS